MCDQVKQQREEVYRLDRIVVTLQEALDISRECFPSREISLVQTNIEQAQLWAWKRKRGFIIPSSEGVDGG